MQQALHFSALGPSRYLCAPREAAKVHKAACNRRLAEYFHGFHGSEGLNEPLSCSPITRTIKGSTRFVSGWLLPRIFECASANGRGHFSEGFRMQSLGEHFGAFRLPKTEGGISGFMPANEMIDMTETLRVQSTQT